LPAPRWTGELMGPRFPPLGDVPLQIQDPEFYLGEPVVIIFDKIFETLVRRYHPRPITCTGHSKLPRPVRRALADGLGYVFDLCLQLEHKYDLLRQCSWPNTAMTPPRPRPSPPLRESAGWP
jgi:hypothetical protein